MSAFDLANTTMQIAEVPGRIAGSRDGAGSRGTIVHVFDHSFPIGDGYANRSGEIIRFVRGMGWRTVHVTSAKQGATKDEKETARGLDFYRTQPGKRLWDRLPILNQWSVVSTLKRRLEQVVRAERPSLLHVHSPCLNGLAAIPVGRALGIPVIYEIRALWEDGAVDSGACKEGDLRYRASRSLETYVSEKAEHVVTICEGLRGEMVSRGLRTEISVAPNSVDIARFGSLGSRDERLAAELGLTPGKTIGFVGSFFPFEGLDVLLNAVSAIRASEPKARFLIVGDGSAGPRLRELASHLGLGDAVTFTGRVPHEDVERYYGLIDILVYPRLSQRLTELVTPLKPLEAMAQGKIVVASDVGGHREMVFPGKNGVLFKAGDSASLSDACIDLLRKPETWAALSENGRNYVATERSWATNVKIYDKLYERMITRKTGVSQESAEPMGRQ